MSIFILLGQIIQQMKFMKIHENYRFKRLKNLQENSQYLGRAVNKWILVITKFFSLKIYLPYFNTKCNFCFSFKNLFCGSNIIDKILKEPYSNNAILNTKSSISDIAAFIFWWVEISCVGSNLILQTGQCKVTALLWS